MKTEGSILNIVSRRCRRVLVTLTAVIMTMGIAAPSAFADMNGIDVSSWQCGINMSAVPGDFAIVKATQGTGYTSPCMTAQLEGARSAGKSIGTYHYAGGGDATAEADYYVNVASRYVKKGLLVLDWESYQNAAWGNGAWVRTWVNRVHARTGVWPVIYVQASAVYQIPSDVRANCMLWKAQYASMAATGYQSNPWNLGSAGEGMLQYSSNGRLPGYGGALDLNLFRGDRTAWNKIATGGSGSISGGSSNVTPAPSPAPSQPSAGQTSVVVRSGDTISLIAARTGLYPLSAWRVPSGNINLIYPGQIVTFGGSSSTSYSSSGGHVVRSGESLWSIYGYGWSAAAARNGIRAPYTIYPGQVLR